MNREDSNTENMLRECRAGGLDERLASRLLAAIDAASTPVDAIDASFESTLAQHKPAALPGRSMALAATLADPCGAADAAFEASLAGIRPAHLSDETLTRAAMLAPSNVVTLPAPERVMPFRRYAAAAAIALVGAAAAFLAPMGGNAPSVADNAPASETPTPRLSPVDARAFVPASHQRGLSEATDEGLVWQNETPHRVLRIVYEDTITLTNEAGEVVEVQQPRVEYILVPEKVD